MIESLQQIYKYRALVEILVFRELKARYRGTFFGFLWSFFNPLIMMAIYVLVFSVYLRINMEHFPIFLLTGLLPWAWFSASISECTHSIISNGGLIKKLYLPSEIFPLVYIISNMIHYVLSIPILLIFMLIFGLKPTWTISFVFIILMVQFLLTFTLGLFFAACSVRFRDLLYIVPNFLMIWFFITPLFYPITQVPDNFRLIVTLNPMAHIIKAYQDIFYYKQIPSFYHLGLVTCVSCILFVFAITLFIKLKGSFAEEV